MLGFRVLKIFGSDQVKQKRDRGDGGEREVILSRSRTNLVKTLAWGFVVSSSIIQVSH